MAGAILVGSDPYQNQEDFHGVVVMRGDQEEGDPFYISGNVVAVGFNTTGRTFRTVELEFRAQDERGVWSAWTEGSQNDRLNNNNKYRLIEGGMGLQYRYKSATAGQMGTTVKIYPHVIPMYTPLSGYPVKA